MGLEIERKFLIKKLPHEALMAKCARVKHIEQSFLIASNGFPVRRIRKVVEGESARYFFTLKRPASGDFSREEIENEISLNQYLELQKERDFLLNEIIKTRYIFEENGLVYEIDRFPFFEDFDMMEIELQSEESEYSIPKEIEVIKEVSTDFRFTNFSLAKEIPTSI